MIGDLAPMTRQELALGWAEFRCKEHGALVATDAWAQVRCRCGRRAQAYRRDKTVGAAEARKLYRAAI